MRFVTLQAKDVINVCDGRKIGFVVDAEIDECSYMLVAILVEATNPLRLCTFFKEPEVIVIPITSVVNIGDDVILVNITT